MDFRRPFYISVYFTLVAVIVAFLLTPYRACYMFRHSTHRLFSGSASSTTGNLMTNKTGSITTPVYFLSHGGPNIMYDVAHPVYSKLQQVGSEITQSVGPRAIVVFSAHWQGQPNVIEVNIAEETELIYDFYGFPPNYYKEEFPHKGSSEVAEKVINILNNAGIKTKATTRGLDHGVWACFKVAFNPTTNPLNIPIVQVSLYGSEDPSQHYALGQALTPLRSEGILLITSGMAVHNLRDMRFDTPFPSVLPYAKTFDEALREAVESSSATSRESTLAALWKRADARRAHPTFEHLLPLSVGAGAAAEDQGKRIWTLLEGSMSWAMFRFGNIPGKIE